MAIGYNAMSQTGGATATDSGDNIFIGVDAGGGDWADAVSSYNVAIGNYAMDAVMNAAVANTSVGYASAAILTSGDYNTMFGSNAGDTITSGTNNTTVGYSANVGAAGATNQTAIGASVTGVNTDNSVTLGNADVTAVYMASDSGATVYCAGVINYGNSFFQGYSAIGVNNTNNAISDSSGTSGGTATLYIGNASITVSSDERIKKNIEDTKINATETLNKLRVVDFEWDDPSDNSYNNRNARVSQGGQWTGLVAQEIVNHVPHIVNAPRKEETLEIDNESEDMWHVDFAHLVPTLVKAVQELSAKVEELEAKLK